MATAEAYYLFFYGTLLHPSVIKRVAAQDVQNLRIQLAVLFVFITLIVVLGLALNS